MCMLCWESAGARGRLGLITCLTTFSFDVFVCSEKLRLSVGRLGGIVPSLAAVLCVSFL